MTFLTSDDIGELAKALASAQGELTEATKSTNNTFFKSKYADLAEVLQTIRPVASKYGLSYVQGLNYSEGLVGVTTRLLHSSGQWLESHLDLPINKKDPQEVGKGATYGRRYALAATFGISQEDDDGNSVSQKKAKDPGSNSQTQGPVYPVMTTGLDLGPVAKAVIAKFESVVGAEHDTLMKQLTSEFASLTPIEQTQVLPAAKAARTRLDEAKRTTAK